MNVVAWLSFEVSNGVMKDPYYYKCVTISKQAEREEKWIAIRRGIYSISVQACFKIP